LRIILAETAGFCMGVKRAMDKVLAMARDRSGPLYTVGPLIHNRQVVEMLEARGVFARTEFDGVREGTVLVRTHGVPPEVVRRLRDAGLDVEDGTCPHVIHGQRAIARRSAEGAQIVIVGDPDHDEVVGLRGHAQGRCDTIHSVDEARTVPLEDDVLVVAQTTFNESEFGAICDELRRRKPDVEVVKSICNATSRRQEEARELAREVDAMVVVGGYHSANTKRLTEVARETGTPTFHVETADELDVAALAQFETVGVTAGASTPGWITNTVLERLRHAEGLASRWGRLRARAATVLLDGNLYVAGGAACVTYAVTKLLGFGDGPGTAFTTWDRVRLMVAAAGYIFSAYSLARTAWSEAATSGLSLRTAFQLSHVRAMRVGAVVLSLIAFAALAPFGWQTLALLVGSYALALAYGVLLRPRRGSALAILRNVPASKDVLSAAGWTMVTVLIPVAAAGEARPGSVIAVAAFVFGLALVRTVMFDFTDVMGDRLIGRDTLPALIGVERARMAMAAVTVLLAGMIVAATASGVIGPLGYWMLLCPLYVLCYLLVLSRAILASEHRCAAVVDGGMWLVGIVALARTVAG
jgi:4-hydroxy-3-methylbut-2-enyl diphosphate reductase